MKEVADAIATYRRKQGHKLLEPLAQPSRARRRFRGGLNYETSSEEEIVPKPTLEIKKNKGSYYIKMNPLKDPSTYTENDYPYLDCTPMQFKVTPSRKTTDDPNRECFCDEEDEKSSESELDIEFTTPAGLIDPEKLRRKHVIHTDTQYLVSDFEPPKPRPKTAKSAKSGKSEKSGKSKGKAKGKKKGKKK